MKPLNTGKMPLDPRAWLAIMSLSLIVNLPGLAVTPMLGTLSKIFPDTTALETQLLTVCPNLLIIPFVLMSGKLSTTTHKKTIICTALLIFAGSTVGYMLSTSMLALILFSCTLGIGAGLLIPFSTGLLSDTFAGKPLMGQMGLQSAISNLTLVVATFAVGWLSMFNWHLPFLVYGVCLIPLALMPFFRLIPYEELNPVVNEKNQPNTTQTSDPQMKCNKSGISVYRLLTLFGLYFLLTWSTISISEYTPFLVKARHFDTSITGTLTSIYFLFVFVSGFSLTRIIHFTKANTIIVAAAIVLAGMAVFTFIPSVFCMGVGVILIGLGYGILQPLFYDKATQTVCLASRSTLALSVVLTANYSAIVLEPFITQGICKISGQAIDGIFPFIISTVLCLLTVVLCVAYRNKFAFSISKSYYE